jgi:hypothetical protein
MSTLARTNLILLAILVVQAVVLIALPKEGAEGGASRNDAGVAGREPFSSVETKDVQGVTLTSGDGKVIKLEATVKKEGDQETKTWALANRDGFPARAADVEKIVEAVRKIKLMRIITRQEKRYAKLNVADGVTHARVQVQGSGGRPMADFRIGESKDFSSVHVRIDGDPAVYEAKEVSTWEFPTAVSGLVDTTFLDLPSDQVVKVKLSAGAESFEVVKETPESRPESAPAETRGSESAPATRPEPKWVVAGDPARSLDKTKVESWIRGLTRVNLGEPIGKEKKAEYGFSTPAATVTLVFADGKETVITIGAERKEERDYYMTATGKDFVVTAASWNVTDQFQKKLADLAPGASTEPSGHEGHDHR